MGLPDFRLIVAGGRDFEDFDMMCRHLDRMLVNRLPGVVIINGDARGADKLSQRYAKLRGLRHREYPADWEKHGKGAGPIRNEQMATEACPDGCVVFWDGKSRGSKDMIDRAVRHGIPTKVVKYN